MDETLTNRNGRRAENASPAGSDASLANPDQQRRSEMCQQRVREYMDQALKNQDPVVASLGYMTGQLLMTGALLDEALQTALRDGPATVERFQKLTPSIDLRLKLARQVERFVQLERREADQKK